MTEQPLSVLDVFLIWKKIPIRIRLRKLHTFLCNYSFGPQTAIRAYRQGVRPGYPLHGASDSSGSL
jgi:hypothetical protein